MSKVNLIYIVLLSLSLRFVCPLESSAWIQPYSKGHGISESSIIALEYQNDYEILGEELRVYLSEISMLVREQYHEEIGVGSQKNSNLVWRFAIETLDLDSKIAVFYPRRSAFVPQFIERGRYIKKMQFEIGLTTLLFQNESIIIANKGSVEFPNLWEDVDVDSRTANIKLAFGGQYKLFESLFLEVDFGFGYYPKAKNHYRDFSLEMYKTYQYLKFSVGYYHEFQILRSYNYDHLRRLNYGIEIGPFHDDDIAITYDEIADFIVRSDYRKRSNDFLTLEIEYSLNHIIDDNNSKVFARWFFREAKKPARMEIGVRKTF